MDNKNDKVADMEMDRTLILKVKRGDKKALGKLVERHKKAAYQMALGMVGNRDDAFDISQEAFLSLVGQHPCDAAKSGGIAGIPPYRQL